MEFRDEVRKAAAEFGTPLTERQEEQFYLEQHHEPLVETEVFDTVQEYVKKGYLNTQNGKLRKNWLMENRDILNRRRNQKHDE